MKLARGKYVTFVDSDDWVSPRYLQSLITPVIEQRADISVVDFQLVDSEKCIYEAREGKNSFKVMDAKEVFKEILYQTYRDVCAWGILLPKQLVQEYPFPKGKLFEDLYTTYHYYFLMQKNTLSVFSLFPAWLAGAHQRILHNHSTAVRSEGIRSVIKMILCPFAPLFANRYAACSRLAGDWMYGKKMMNSGKATIINNAVDLEEYAFSQELREKYRQELNIPADAFVVGHVGRFMYQKNHAFLIDVFREVARQNSKAILMLVGDGELRPEIEQKVASYNLTDKVRFLGLRKDVKKLYNCMNVFVLPSWYEGLPVVSVEAQANGLPSIFSD